MSYPPTSPTYTITEELDYPANIWRWATTDPVKGASSGGATDDVDNYPITQLANRTKYLKAISNGMLTKSVAGSADVALTAAEAANGIIKLTGALTDDINVTVPDGLTRSWVVINATTGTHDIDPGTGTLLSPYTITFKTASGTGVLIEQGGIGTVYSDGTNIIGGSANFAGFAASGNDDELFLAGYQKLESGLIIQWGAGKCGNFGVIEQLYPIAFPTTILSCVMTEIDVGGWLGHDVTVYGRRGGANIKTTLYGEGIRITGDTPADQGGGVNKSLLTGFMWRQPGNGFFYIAIGI